MNLPTSEKNDTPGITSRNRALITVLLIILCLCGLLCNYKDRSAFEKRLHSLESHESVWVKRFSELQQRYNRVLPLVDSLTAQNKTLYRQLQIKQMEAEALHSQISSLLRKHGAVSLAAKLKAERLNGIISDLQSELEVLKKNTAVSTASVSIIHDTLIIHDTVALNTSVRTIPEKYPLYITSFHAKSIPVGGKGGAVALDFVLHQAKKMPSGFSNVLIVLVIHNETGKIWTDPAANNVASGREYSAYINFPTGVDSSIHRPGIYLKKPLSKGNYTVKLLHGDRELISGELAVQKTENPYPF